MTDVDLTGGAVHSLLMDRPRLRPLFFSLFFSCRRRQ